MQTNAVSLRTLEDIRQHVHEMLCRRDNLDPAATPLRLAKITRSGRPCGLFFQMMGPRHVRNYAVWAGDEGRILFYDSTGNRFNETRLTESPDPMKIAA